MTKPTAKTPATVLTKKLKETEWATIEALWEAGATSYAELEKRYGKSESTFQRRFKEKGIKFGSKADEAKAAAAKAAAGAISTKSAADAAVLAARITETKEDHYKMATAISKLIWNEILSTRSGPTPAPISTALNNIKTLKEALSGLKIAREERWLVLGLDRPDAVDPEALPTLEIAELTESDIEELRKRDQTELDDLVGVPDDLPDDAEEGEDEDDGVVSEGGA